MVAHPDQSNLDTGQLRVAVSLRQIGEGHVSSIGFATAVIGPAGRLTVTDRSGPLATGRRTGASQRRDLLAAGLSDEGLDNEVFASVLGSLPAPTGRPSAWVPSTTRIDGSPPDHCTSRTAAGN